MALLEEQKRQMRERLQQAGLSQETKSALDTVREKREKVRAEQNTKKKSLAVQESDFAGRVQERFEQRGQEVSDIFQKRGEEMQQTGTAGKIKAGVAGVAETLGRGASFVSDIGQEALTSGFRALLGDEDTGFGGRLREKGREFAQDPNIAPILKGLGVGIEKLEELEEDHPVWGALGRVGVAVTELTGVAKLGRAGVSAAQKAGQGFLSKVDDFAPKLPELTVEPPATLVGGLESVSPKLSSEMGILSRRRVYKAEEKARIEQALAQSTPDIQEAVKQGIDLKEARLIAETTPQERVVIKQMHDIAEADIIGDTTKTPPRAVVGEHLYNRVRAVDTKKAEVGEQLGDIADKIPNQRVVNSRLTILDRIKSVPGMKNAEMILTREGLKINFAKTPLADDITAQAKINDVFNKAATKTASEMHLYRQFLFDDIAKSTSTRVRKVDMKDEQVLDAIRAGMKDVISKADKTGKYAELSKDYAVLEGAMKEARQKFKAVDGADDDLMNLRAGELARRLTSNASADMQAFLRDLETVIREYELLNDGVDIVKLQEALNVLDRYYKFSPETGFKTQIERAIENVSPSIGSMVSKAIGVAKEKAIPSITPETARRALSELIKSLE